MNWIRYRLYCFVNLFFLGLIRGRRESSWSIRLAVFVDDAMWAYFRREHGLLADEELRRYALAITDNVNALYSHDSLESSIRFNVTHFEVFRKAPPVLHRQSHFHGDVANYIRLLCAYQTGLSFSAEENSRLWDHALLLSGYDLHLNGDRTIAGYAPMRGMCSRTKSCTLVEALDFGSVFVAAHELGHSLGMLHDGEDNECDSAQYIMSPTLSGGGTSWSNCSAKELKSFIKALQATEASCLTPSVADHHAEPRIREEMPGQLYPADVQCEIFIGRKSRHIFTGGQKLEGICTILWCSDAALEPRPAHPALEGTSCEKEKYCIGGKCVPWTTPWDVTT